MKSPAFAYYQSRGLIFSVLPQVVKLEDHGMFAPMPFELSKALLTKSFESGWSIT